MSHCMVTNVNPCTRYFCRHFAPIDRKYQNAPLFLMLCTRGKPLLQHSHRETGQHYPQTGQHYPEIGQHYPQTGQHNRDLKALWWAGLRTTAGLWLRTPPDTRLPVSRGHSTIWRSIWLSHSIISFQLLMPLNSWQDMRLLKPHPARPKAKAGVLAASPLQVKLSKGYLHKPRLI